MVCNKCGRPVSSRLSRPIPLCMRCRYQAMRQGAPSIAAKIRPKIEGKAAVCVQCGKEIPGTSSRSRRLYCDHCRRYRKKTCIQCGAEFEINVKDVGTRDVCWSCRPKFHQSDLEEMAPKKPKALTRRQKAEKMRAIKASGLTYGQYMALVSAGQPIPEPPEEMQKSGTQPQESGWIPVGQALRGPAPKARIKIMPKNGERCS